MCQSPRSLTDRWEEGGIFRLLKVHLLHFQQVLVSNEGNDECLCGDELACAGGGYSQQSGSARLLQLKLSPFKHLNRKIWQSFDLRILFLS